MLKLDREKAISFVALFALVLVSIIVPSVCLKLRSDAAQALAGEEDMLVKLEAAYLRSGRKPLASEAGTAPDTAFLNAPTSGLASAQLEAYLAQLASVQQASVVSSGVEPSYKDRPENVRIQAKLDVRYDALQTLLYQLETGTPYIFVDLLTLQPSNTSQLQSNDSVMQVTMSLRALWRQAQP